MKKKFILVNCYLNKQSELNGQPLLIYTMHNIPTNICHKYLNSTITTDKIHLTAVALAFDPVTQNK